MTYHSNNMPTTERIIAPQSSHMFFTSFIYIYFSTLSSNKLLFNECVITVIFIDNSEMIDLDEDVALEFNNWIGGIQEFFLL